MRYQDEHGGLETPYNSQVAGMQCRFFLSGSQTVLHRSHITEELSFFEWRILSIARSEII